MHESVGDHRRASHVPGVLHDRDEEEEDQDLGEEDEHRPHPGPHSVHQQGAEPGIGQHTRNVFARGSDQRLGGVHEGYRPREDGLEDQSHHHGEDDRSPQTMQHEAVEPVGEA